MTLRTITYDTATHKLVPREPTDLMLDNAVELALLVAITKNYRWQQYMRDVWSRMIEAAPEYQEPNNPLDTPIPCDIKVGHGTIEKGCKLSTLVRRMNVLYEMAMKNQLDIKLDQDIGKDE